MSLIKSFRFGGSQYLGMCLLDYIYDRCAIFFRNFKDDWYSSDGYSNQTKTGPGIKTGMLF